MSTNLTHRREENPSIPGRGKRISLGRFLLGLGSLLAIAVPGRAQVEELFRCVAKGKDVTPCTVCLVPYILGKEYVCTQDRVPVSIPPGRYEIRAWDKTRGLVMAQNSSVTVQREDKSPAGKPFATMVDLGPGGSVEVPVGTLPPTGAVQILSLATGRVDTLFLDHEHDVPFPAGSTLAIGLAAAKKLVGVTRPFEVRPGSVTTVSSFPRPPSGKGDLLVRFDYPEDRPLEMKQDVEITLTPSDVMAATPARASAATNLPKDAHYSFFYGLSSGRYSVNINSRYWRIRPASVEVKSGEFRIADEIPILFKPRIAAEVHDATPSGGDRYDLTLYECPRLGPGTLVWPDLKSCTPIRTATTTKDVQFLGLDARWYFLLAKSGKRKAGAHVDLRDGLDKKVPIEFRRTHVHGTVSRGGSGIVADLRFQNLDEETASPARSGTDGSFDVDLFTAGLYDVFVAPPAMGPGREAKFSLDLMSMPDDLRRDFEIPRGDVKVLLLDEKSRQPVDGATLTVTIAGSGQTLAADSLGEVLLPPIPPGPLSGSADAKGYARQRTTLPIKDTDELQRFEVLLRPLRDDLSFQVVSPTGAPVPSPMLFGRFDGSRFLLIQPCDSDGLCRFAAAPAAGEIFFLAQKDLGLTTFPGEVAVDQHSVTMNPSGGKLVLSMKRGVQTATAMLAVEAEINGTPVPLDALVMISSITQTMDARVILSSGGEDSFIVGGLPAGAVVCHVRQVLSTGRLGPDLVAPVGLSLPQAGAAAVSLP